VKEHTGAWTRLTYSPSSGKLTAEGSPENVLGLSADELTSAEDPAGLLPPCVYRGLTEGGDIIRDDSSSLVVIPSDIPHNNSVIVLKEKADEIDLVPDIASGVVGFSPDGKIVRWNKRMSYLFGPREKDVIGRNASDILPAPVLYNWTSVISSAHQGHEVRIEFRPAGDKRVEGILSQGGPGVIGLFFDSTESYKTGKRLRALNRLNQAYLQSTSTGLLLLDSQLRILLSNSGFSRISGERGSLIGQQLHEVVPEESYKWIHDSSERLFGEDRSDNSSIITFRNRDGEILTLNHILKVVRNEMNQAVNFVCLFEDRTEQMRLQRENSKLRKNLEGITRLSEDISATGRRNGGDLCSKIMRLTGSKAVAEFTYDQSETLRLSGSAGSWPSKPGADEPAALGFPGYVWRDDGIHSLGASELGILSGVFSDCIVVPIGSGAGGRGFLILFDSAMTTDDSEVLKLAASLTGMILSVPRGIRQSSVEKGKAAGDSVFTGFFSDIPFPLAMITKDGSPEYWNASMARLTGLERAEITGDDLQNLIDPDGHGLSLDSLASTDVTFFGEDSMVWSVKKRDGTFSEPHRWHVSLIEQPQLFKGDYGFLLAGIPSYETCKPVPGRMEYRRVCLDLVNSLSKAIVSRTEEDTLRSVWNICSRLEACSILKFYRDGILIAAYPDREGTSDTPCSEVGPLLLVGGVEYEVRSSSSAGFSLIEPVCEMISAIRGADESAPAHHGDQHSEIRQRLQLMVGYMEEFCQDSIKQSNAILTIVEESDPFSGFARTMLLSQETASRVTALIRMALSAYSGVFRKVSLQRFMAGFPSAFAEIGLRPPSLTLSDRLPEVMIVPEIVFKGVTRMCHLKGSETVISFSVDPEKTIWGIRAVLKISGLSEEVTESEITDGFESLKKGIFDTNVEISILSTLLSVAGCSIMSSPGAQCTICFTEETPQP